MVVLCVADSTVLVYVLKILNEKYDYGVDLILLSVDEGITGYRDDSLEVRTKINPTLRPPILGHTKDVLWWWPSFLRFFIQLGALFMLSMILLTLIYASRIDLSLSHLVPEIFGSKIGLMFHQNVLLNSFKHYVPIFTMILYPVFQWSWIFLTTYFYKTLDVIESIFYCMLNPLPNIWWSPFKLCWKADVSMVNADNLISEYFYTTICVMK